MSQDYDRPGPRCWAIITIGVLVASILTVVWAHPWFVTQDGSIYLYNAHVILKSLRSNNPFQDYYSVRWVALPYWGAYLLLGALMSLLPARIADHLMVSISSVGLLACILWLHHKVAGWDGMALVAPFAGIVSISLIWLLGFYNFLLGACCYVVSVGLWWAGRDHMGWKRALPVAGLLVAGYLCHPVSSGLTVVALVVLCLGTPGAGWRRRAAWTLASVLPSLLLIYLYQRRMPGPSETRARWDGLADPFSLRQWLIYARAADITPIAHTGSNLLFGHTISRWSHLPAVTTLALLGLVLLLLSAFSYYKSERAQARNTMRGLLTVSALFILCGLFGPASLGDVQGAFLRQRFLLLGLATAVPILRAVPAAAGPRSLVPRLGFAALSIGCAIQLAAVWGYAEVSNRLAAEFIQAKPYVGTGQRVAALIVEPEIDYEPRPLLHISDLLGIETGNVIWNNYAPALSYFPIQFRDPSDRDLFYGRGIPDFEHHQIAPEDLEDWEDLLSEIEAKTDALVVWGRSAELDEVNSEWFGDDPVYQSANVRVLRHLPSGLGQASSMSLSPVPAKCFKQCQGELLLKKVAGVNP